MSYSIDEGIEDAEQHAQFLREVKAKYGKNTRRMALPNGDYVWAADGVHEIATGASIVVKDKSAYLCPHIEVEGKYLFDADYWEGSIDLGVRLYTIEKDAPEDFEKLLNLLLRRTV